MNRSKGELNQRRNESFLLIFNILNFFCGAREGMDEREYAAHSRLSHRSMKKARRNGRVVVDNHGSINTGALDAHRVCVTDPDQPFSVMDICERNEALPRTSLDRGIKTDERRDRSA
jgi:hypothetical protein